MKIHKLTIIGLGHVGSEVLTKAVASNIALALIGKIFE